jgi:hypothetical protein
VNPARVGVALLLALIVGAGTARADRADQPSPARRCDALASRLHVGSSLRPVVAEMCRLSPTFRRQVVRLSQQTDLAITVEPGFFAPASRSNANTAINWVQGALRTADVRVAPGDTLKLVELVAHEFEHILEQVDGVNLTRWIGRAGVRRVGGESGPIETERARRIGRLVALEFATAGAETTARRASW